MSTIFKLLEECENIYYKLQESNDTTFFRFKLVHSIYNTLYNYYYFYSLYYLIKTYNC